MATAKVLVITGYGTNCERETAQAARLAGADSADIAHFADLTAGRVRLTDYDFLLLPGGFLDGDDLGAAQAAALRWQYAHTADGGRLLDQLQTFVAAGGLILGICNGFQLLVKLGLLPAAQGASFTRQVSLSHNDSGRYEDRWVWLRAEPDSPCVFTRGIETMYLPVRHGEGKLVFLDQAVAQAVDAQHLVALRYVHPETKEPTQEYPWNPNGSPAAIAGLTDPTGRILGLMPHPEAYQHPTNHPAWTRGESGTLGVELLANAIRHLKAR